MLTIEEIKKRKAEGKKKWRSSLIPFMRQQLDEKMPMESIASFLFETYQLSITLQILYKIKSDFYNAKNITFEQDSLARKEDLTEVLNQESTAEKLHEKINSTEKMNSHIELGDDF